MIRDDESCDWNPQDSRTQLVYICSGRSTHCCASWTALGQAVMRDLSRWVEKLNRAEPSPPTPRHTTLGFPANISCTSAEVSPNNSSARLRSPQQLIFLIRVFLHKYLCRIPHGTLSFYSVCFVNSLSNFHFILNSMNNRVFQQTLFIIL